MCDGTNSDIEEGFRDGSVGKPATRVGSDKGHPTHTAQFEWHPFLGGDCVPKAVLPCALNARWLEIAADHSAII